MMRRIVSKTPCGTGVRSVGIVPVECGRLDKAANRPTAVRSNRAYRPVSKALRPLWSLPGQHLFGPARLGIPAAKHAAAGVAQGVHARKADVVAVLDLLPVGLVAVHLAQ